ncbi:MAG: restriction endonuclease [Candidatus Tectomicrobia bacterium]|nr:restriction endonuclease [Candidatus Tectomicrobia bacterium]
MVRRDRQRGNQQHRTLSPQSDDSTEDTPEDRHWLGRLLDIVRGIPPDAFERFCQRVIRESGFTKMEVTGRSGDGGIDGAGELRVNLISFHVRFQCKRYSGSVGARDIRDFIGAMVGRADKGLFLTTGRFTREAERGAVRHGAPAIDLIDGLALCNLLRTLELGVTTETVEVHTPKREFFERL